MIKIIRQRIGIAYFFSIGFIYLTFAQNVKLSTELGLLNYFDKNITSFDLGDQPLISFEINKVIYNSKDKNLPISIVYISEKNKAGSIGLIKISNLSRDTITIRNVLPLGIKNDQVYITGLGDHSLSRAHLFIPDQDPINIILPDNAWNLGMRIQKINGYVSIYALTRRIAWDKASRTRFETSLFPGGSVNYDLYVDTFRGDWREGFRKCFQEKMIYDLPSFDESIYKRTDLKWIKKVKMIHLLMAWDHRIYDRKNGKYVLESFIKRNIITYGGDDAIGVWPTWPALGMDQNNQWDMFRNMPGGLQSLRKLSALCHKYGIKFFICYNPWDESTRKEDHLKGMADLIQYTDADGVVLDTRGSSSKALQQAADSVRRGVVMYSEGMAIPKDMESIISGRVHNALYYPPVLNLNKLIRPDFGIFRVTEIYKEPIRREINISLFNGHGIEFNLFHPGNRADEAEDYTYLGKALGILHQHNTNFIGFGWQPIIQSLNNKILINYWPGENKDIYTLFNTSPEGYQGPILEINKSDLHWVDLWNHKELFTEKKENTIIVHGELESFNKKYVGTNNEGSVSAIAGFHKFLNIHFESDLLSLSSSRGDSILIWHDKPAYNIKPKKFDITQNEISLFDSFNGKEGDFVIQLFDHGELIDERIITIRAGTARLISKSQKAMKGSIVKMAKIPTDTFTFYSRHGDEFIPYSDHLEGRNFKLPSFYMDIYPVTNKEFYIFLFKSKYKPKHPENFLKHWPNGKLPKNLESYPVVNISLEDARAYASWAGKRMPTEIEWQYAAQTSKRYTWPWGHPMTINYTAEVVNETLTHYQTGPLDSTLANPGNGFLDPVGHYPKGVNPFGLHDLVGSVWQMTNDEYACGSYRYSILKGGSYYKPASSWWYVQGGPQELNWRQMLLFVYPGFERKNTVGFRCVRDVE